MNRDRAVHIAKELNLYGKHRHTHDYEAAPLTTNTENWFVVATPKAFFTVVTIDGQYVELSEERVS